MIASLYHSGSSSPRLDGCEALSPGMLSLRASVTALLTGHRPQNVALPHPWVESDVMPFSAPRVTHIVDQVVSGVAILRRGSGCVDWWLHPFVLQGVGVEIDDDEQDVRA